MGYQIGATYATLVNAETVFFSDLDQRVKLSPRSDPIPGGDEYDSMDGVHRWRGYKRSRWHFDNISIQSYEMAVAILCSTAGTGTVSRNAGDHTQLDGSGTAFTSQLSVGDTVIAHLGSGTYEHMVVTTIHDNTTLHVSAAIQNALSGVTFRYRSQSVFSGNCYVTTYVTTHLGVNVFSSFSAVARCPAPSALQRWGHRYQGIVIDFLLKAIATS